MDQFPKEPWYVITGSSSTPKVIKFCVATLTLASALGACLWTDVVAYPLLRFIIGIGSTSCLLFVTYNQGVVAGASSMYTFLQERARSVASAMSMMDEALRKKNEEK
jgi:hypothetical protein